MFENTADIIKQISLCEDSVLELKTVEFSGDKITGPQSVRNELLSSLLARCPMNVNAIGSQRSFIMDKRGEGVPSREAAPWRDRILVQVCVE